MKKKKNLAARYPIKSIQVYFLSQAHVSTISICIYLNDATDESGGSTCSDMVINALSSSAILIWLYQKPKQKRRWYSKKDIFGNRRPLATRSSICKQSSQIGSLGRSLLCGFQASCFCLFKSSGCYQVVKGL